MSAQRNREAPASAALRRRWQAIAQAEGLDPRREPWCWDGEGRLLLRPGPALRAARRFAAEAPGAFALVALRDEAVHRVCATRSALRREPAHTAEQVSQLRLGDRFIGWHWNAEKTWCLGAGEDGYPGWLRAWHLSPGGGARPRRVVMVRASRALVAPRAGAAALVDLSFGTRLAPTGPARAGYIPWRLPDGRRAWTLAADLAPWPGRRGEAAARALLIERGLALLGLPYEWGGASSAGVDCSGFVQLLLGSLGRLAPRDADLQADWAHPQALESPAAWRPGNLLCFGEVQIDHVGILAGEGLLLHASGEVRLEELGDGGALRGRAPCALRDPFAGP